MDPAAFCNTPVPLPLPFLGGVFYSVDVLPSPWLELSHVNPIFYLVQPARYVFLGTSDVSFALALAVALALTLFSSLGVVVGIYAESWDHTAFVNNLAILPLTFLGGVFYSIDVLPSPWQEISHANPIFFLVQAVRYGFLGTSDVPVELALAITGGLAALCVAWSTWLFSTGHKLKT